MKIKEQATPQKKITDYIKHIKEQPSGFVYLERKDKNIILEKLKKQCTNCIACPLATQGRKQPVFGEGNINTKLMFIGEGPGRDEDAQGRVFIGRAGKLLTKIIESMGLDRKDVYISNVVKCRPPNNRTPLPEEGEVCKNLFLFKEIDTIAPKIICTLGSCATQSLLGKDVRISKVRGTFHNYKQYSLLPTYHPAYLLRNPAEKRKVWEDMKKITTSLSKIQ